MPREWSYDFAAVKSPQGLVFTSRDFFDRAISTLGDGEEVTVKVSKRVDKRSLQQNRALWGPIYDQLIQGVRDKLDATFEAIAEQTGVDKHDRIGKEHMHEGLLQLFSGTVIDPVTHREVAKERSSTMSTTRFAEFIEWIARYAADEHGVVVTLPGEM